MRRFIWGLSEQGTFRVCFSETGWTERCGWPASEWGRKANAPPTGYFGNGERRRDSDGCPHKVRPSIIEKSRSLVMGGGTIPT